MLHESFPRYTDHNPKIPVWCLTPNRPGCIHRFFDTSPISPSGRYLAVFQLPVEDRQPQPGEPGNVVVVDLTTGEDKVVAETCGWEPQMGANINWGGSDNELYFNDVDTASWKPFAWKCDPLSGEKQRMQGTVYHASPDGKWLISANMTAMRRTQPGYGVRVPDEKARYNRGPVDDDGFYMTNTATGESRLLLSTKQIFDQADPPIRENRPDRMDIYGFHSKFNPRGDRMMLSLRWYDSKGPGMFNVFSRRNEIEVRYAWVTCTLDGTELHCAAGPEEWEKGGHHATWFPDVRHISMNLKIDRDVMRFAQVNYDGSELRKILDGTLGSGHPTIHKNGRFLLTDTYTHESLAFGDGTTPLRWIDLSSGREETIVRIHTMPDYTEDKVLRIDPHPAWDPTWRYITFNAFVGGTRRVFIADMQDILS